MQRILPLVAAQARPRPIGEPVSVFADEVKEALEAQPHSKLVVFPELHLFGDQNPDLQRIEMLQASAEPLDGPRVKELKQLAEDLNIWLVPGSVCERGPEGQLFNTQLVLSSPDYPVNSWSFDHLLKITSRPPRGSGAFNACLHFSTALIRTYPTSSGSRSQPWSRKHQILPSLCPLIREVPPTF
ncbi:nitrilase-related carbon-nitrogen hydrolase [Arthrobacter sp. Soil764]|uniref:nitrilase-related carbon-nitrogen hydrolase n=1 Tax=Arthrobacter sp. Soil764 TaxID=1736403 RepID=UPI000AD60662|nr:nitrilase-related carbon-nitrogen hydrolase [Arthrobacter sp. Soil764]